MIYTFNQSFTSATPPAIGVGSGISLSKSPRLKVLPISKYNEEISSRQQFSVGNNLYYNVDVNNADGTTVESDYETGLRDVSYLFDFDKNTGVFGAATGYRSYQLAFKLYDVDQASISTGKYNIYHNAAQISGVTSVVDGTEIGGNPQLTGRIDINLSMTGKSYYNVSKFEIYSGDNSSFSIATGTGGNLLKTSTVFTQSTNYTLSIFEGEQPANNSYYHYKLVPYDDFGSGVHFSSAISGIMYTVSSPTFTVETLTGKNIVLLNDGMYSIQGASSGVLSGDWTKLDIVPNISGNISSLGYYNTLAEGDFVQNDTYLFKTLKYTVQTLDFQGNVSSREILVTDNTTSTGSYTNTGILYSEYAVSDRNESALFAVSSSGVGTGALEDYQNGSGYLYLYGRAINGPATYKLYKTWL